MKSTAAVLAFASAALFAATRKRKPSLSKAVSTSRGILGRAKESQLNARRVAEQTAERYHDVCHHSSMVVGGCTRLAPASPTLKSEQPAAWRIAHSPTHDDRGGPAAVRCTVSGGARRAIRAINGGYSPA